MFDLVRQKLASLLLPSTAPHSAVAVNGLPPSIAGSLDADMLSAIIREAEQGQMDRYLRLCAEIWGGDISVYTNAFIRKAGVLSQPWQVVASDDSPDAKIKARLLQEQLSSVQGFRAFLNHSLDSAIWPVAVSRKIYTPSRRQGIMYDLTRLDALAFYRLDFQGGHGDPAGCLRIKTVVNGQITGDTTAVTSIEHVIHRGHLLKTFPDTWGGPFRAALFWWFFATCDRQWWARSLNKFGVPFLVGRVQETDKKGKSALLRAFNNISQMIGLVVSEGTKIEVHQTLSSASTDSFERFHALCRGQLSALITGSTQTVEAQAQGLGGGQAQVQDSRLDNITQHDGAELAETIREQIFVPWLQLNGLGADHAPTIIWGATPEDAAAKSTVVQTAYAAGLRLTAAGLADFNASAGLEFEFTPPAITGFAATPRAPRDALAEIEASFLQWRPATRPLEYALLEAVVTGQEKVP